MFKFGVCILITIIISYGLNKGINFWQSLPVKELKKDHPLYIKKILFKD